MSDWQPVGAHRFRDQGELLFLEPHGEVSRSQAEAWTAIITSHFQRERQGFLLIDARDLKPPAAEIRRAFLTWLRATQPRPRILVFGANLLVRTASRLVLAAARQLYHLDLDLTQFATEAEARAHAESMRSPRPPEPPPK